MLPEFIIRFSFFVILLVVYALGIYITPIINSCFGVTVRCDVILPILYLIFGGYWIRFFYPIMCSITLKSVSTGKNRFTLDFRISYDGDRTVPIRIKSVGGMKNCNIFLNCKQKEFIPEDLNENLSSDNPCLDFSLLCIFRNAPTPNLWVPLLNWAIFRLTTNIQIKEKNKQKTFYLIQNSTGKIIWI